jgi:hypothetical protein
MSDTERHLLTIHGDFVAENRLNNVDHFSVNKPAAQ